MHNTDFRYHYTVDRVSDLDRFIVDVYCYRRGSSNSIPVDKVFVPINKLHTILKKFSDAGYIADRIAF